MIRTLAFMAIDVSIAICFGVVASLGHWYLWFPIGCVGYAILNYRVKLGPIGG